jgi:DNA (cytosine-5)-methyltransferase 1
MTTEKSCKKYLRRKAEKMTEVQVIDLFSGCGGMSCGFSLAETENISYKLLGGLDIDIHANATYEKMLGRPALNMSASDLLKEDHLAVALETWGYEANRPLVLIGCAPCQGFSSHRKKDGRVDDRNDLINVFGKIICRLKPEVVVMENVPELLHTKHWAHFGAFKSMLETAGYLVRARLHNAAEFGVPQERFRALMIASRNPSNAHMPSPTNVAAKYVSVRDAIGYLPPLDAGQSDPNDPMHLTSKHRPKTVELLRAIPPDGGSRSSLPPEMVRECHKGVDGFRDVYGRLWWDRPSVAITARCRTPSCGRFTHPEQHRGLSVREAALLQSFPSNWNFEGPFDDKYKQIGNAVPPNLAKAIASTIDKFWSADVLPDPRELANDVQQPITRSISSSIGAWKRRARNADGSVLEN